MKSLSTQSKNILEQVDTPLFMALEELRVKLIEYWTESNIKKETEFDTVWCLAEREGKIKGLTEFLQYLSNPRR